MPSQETANKGNKLVLCEVLRGIGIEATPDIIKAQKERADRKGIRFEPAGLTTMIFPNPKVFNPATKKHEDGEPVLIDLEPEVARKLQKAGAVRAVI